MACHLKSLFCWVLHSSEHNLQLQYLTAPLFSQMRDGFWINMSALGYSRRSIKMQLEKLQKADQKSLPAVQDLEHNFLPRTRIPGVLPTCLPAAQLSASLETMLCTGAFFCNRVKPVRTLRAHIEHSAPSPVVVNRARGLTKDQPNQQNKPSDWTWQRSS